MKAEITSSLFHVVSRYQTKLRTFIFVNRNFILNPVPEFQSTRRRLRLLISDDENIKNQSVVVNRTRDFKIFYPSNSLFIEVQPTCFVKVLHINQTVKT